MAWIDIKDRLPENRGDYRVKWSGNEQVQLSSFEHGTFFCLVSHWWDPSALDDKGKDYYSKEEVIEILRQVMFTGTPELYDQGGMHRNVNLAPDHTTIRAKEAFEKYYLSK